MASVLQYLLFKTGFTDSLVSLFQNVSGISDLMTTIEPFSKSGVLEIILRRCGVEQLEVVRLCNIVT